MNTDQILQAPQEISSLMQKPVCMMSGEELCKLAQYAQQSNPIHGSSATAPQTTNVIGVKALAVYLGCSESTIYSIKKQGILDKAMYSGGYPFSVPVIPVHFLGVKTDYLLRS